MNATPAKWRRWHETIGGELRRLVTWRSEWQALAHDASTDHRRRSFVEEVYAHALAMGVRRQLKAGSRDISMARLLDDVATHARLLSTGTSGLTTAAAVRRDLSDLIRLAKPAEAFADRVVAHADRRAQDEPPLPLLHASLDRLVALHTRYGRLLSD